MRQATARRGRRSRGTRRSSSPASELGDRARQASRWSPDNATGSLHGAARRRGRSGAARQHLVVRAVRATRACARRIAARSAGAHGSALRFRRARYVIVASAPTSSRPGARRSRYARGFAAMRARPRREARSSRSSRGSRSPARTPTSGSRSGPAARWRWRSAWRDVILVRGPRGRDPARAPLATLVAAYTPESGERADRRARRHACARLARAFATQRPSLAVAGGIAAQSEQSVALLAAVNLLNYVAGNVGRDRALRSRARTSTRSRSFSRRPAPDRDAMGQGAGRARWSCTARTPRTRSRRGRGSRPAIDKVPFKVALATVDRRDRPIAATWCCRSRIRSSRWRDAETGARRRTAIVQPGDAAAADVRRRARRATR